MAIALATFWPRLISQIDFPFGDYLADCCFPEEALPKGAFRGERED